MKKYQKIIFWSAIAFIALVVSVTFTRVLLGIAYVDEDMKYNFQRIAFFGIGLALLLTLFGIIKAKDSNLRKLVKFVISICAISYILFMLFIAVFFDMCTTTNHAVLYEKISNPNTKIVLQKTDCGATDSDPYGPKTYKVQKVTKYFIRSTKIDTVKIDMDKWEKIK